MLPHYNLAMIGCGRIGKMHLSILRRFPNITIKAIVDDCFQTDDANLHGIVHANKDLDKVLARNDIDAVVIAAPSSKHMQLIKDSIRHGKHIFCEKPVSFRYQDTHEIAALLDENKIKFQVGLNRRFDADFMYVREQIKTGILGKVHILKVTNRDPQRPDIEFCKHSGGLFYDFNIHDFDLVRHLTGSDVEEVYAMGAVLIDEALHTIPDIDTATISLKMTNGEVAIIDCSRETNYGYDQRIEVFGEHGAFFVENVAKTNTRHYTAIGVISEKPYFNFAERYHRAYEAQFLAFLTYLANDIPSPAGITDIYEALRVADAAQRSYQTNTPVKL